MKTDKERLTELLTSFGVEWREKDGNIKCGGGGDYAKITGYAGFYTKFVFKEDGSFYYMGAWE